MKTINQEGFVFDSYDKAEGGEGGLHRFQGGVTAPPKGLRRNFTAASSTSTTSTSARITRAVRREGRGASESEGEGEGEGEDRGVFFVPPTSSSPLRQPALVCRGAYDPFSSRYEKVARSEEESSQSMLLK